MPGHYAVQALAIQVDDPEYVAELCRRDGRVGDRFPDVALVELGVADQRHVASTRPVVAGAEMRLGVAVGERGEQGRRRAEPDRAGRDIDRVRVLGPARVRLQTVEVAQLGQVAPIEVTQQVLDGVERGTGVGLDRHPIACSQPGEIERGQDGDNGGAARLVATHLGVVHVRTDVVRLVDDAGRQPEHPPLDGLERRQTVRVRPDWSLVDVDQLRRGAERAELHHGPECSALGVRGQGAGVRGQGSGVRGQGSGVRGQGSGVRGQGSGVRGQGSGVRGRGRTRSAPACTHRPPTPDPRPPTPTARRAARPRPLETESGSRARAAPPAAPAGWPAASRPPSRCRARAAVPGSAPALPRVGGARCR